MRLSFSEFPPCWRKAHSQIISKYSVIAGTRLKPAARGSYAIGRTHQQPVGERSENLAIFSSEGGLSPMSSLTDQWYDGVASSIKPQASPSKITRTQRKCGPESPDCALRKKAALFRDANCAVVLEVVRWAITANHPRMGRYGEVQLRRARWGNGTSTSFAQNEMSAGFFLVPSTSKRALETGREV
jgi:hypothetical protein